MISNEEINKFIEDTLDEMKQIDEQLEQAKAMNGNKVDINSLSPAEKDQVDEMLAQAQEEAKAAGRQRAAELESRLNINKPAVKMNSRRLGIGNMV